MKLDKDSELKKKLHKWWFLIFLIVILITGLLIAAFVLDVPSQMKAATSNKEGTAEILKSVWQMGWIKSLAGSAVLFAIILFVANEKK